MNNTPRENGTMAGPLIFTVPAYGFVMALYLDWLRRTPTRERLPLTCVEHTRKRRSGFGWPTHRGPSNPFTGFFGRQEDLPEIFDCIVLVSHRNGRARVGQTECHARTVLKLDFELGLGLMNGFHFAPRRYRRSTACLDLHARLIVEQNQNTPWFDRHSVDCSAGDYFRQLLVSWHNLLPRSTCWGMSTIKRIQLRHELALFSLP
jgi:hypothetical protein